MRQVLILLLAVAFPATGALADSGDENEIRLEIQGYLEAWNSGDAQRLASFYTEDGDRANNRGDFFRGRAAILDHYKRLFANPPSSGSERRLVYDHVYVRVVSEDAAVVDVEYEVSGTSAEVDRSVRGRNTVFMVKRDGRWMRVAHRNALPVSPACLNLCADQDLLPWQQEE
jgi:uncharacterized protein (TIGR02246 family)